MKPEKQNQAQSAQSENAPLTRAELQAALAQLQALQGPVKSVQETNPAILALMQTPEYIKASPAQKAHMTMRVRYSDAERTERAKAAAEKAAATRRAKQAQIQAIIARLSAAAQQ